MTQPGARLLLCPTPLGNLGDITLRTLEALRSCDVIFAEDTRVTAKLLNHYGIAKPLRSYHARVLAKRARELAMLLDGGKSVAAVADAGMPGISDPGAELVRLARARGAAVECLPGATAFAGALVLSGFDVGRFRFESFPPRKPGARRDYLRALETETVAVAWYEAPTRVLGLLEDIEATLSQRRVFVLREYTKKFEQQALGTAAEVRSELGLVPRGEIVVVLEGAPKRRLAEREPQLLSAALGVLVAHGVSVKEAVDAFRKVGGVPRNRLYELAQGLESAQALRGARKAGPTLKTR
ncbi:MAG: 16S rRNA (cytidine(1402)-2'-O)-methyltransferase [Candidatus Eremiobacteraeota bacterium]|nr:16S rRNA (cytidine(1402)-2'-O)-methyltransferase [Candidatus Eremiobacteraeota bacterium]